MIQHDILKWCFAWAQQAVEGVSGDGRFFSISSQFTEDFGLSVRARELWLHAFFLNIKPSQLRLTIYQCIAMISKENKLYNFFFGWIQTKNKRNDKNVYTLSMKLATTKI